MIAGSSPGRALLAGPRLLPQDRPGQRADPGSLPGPRDAGCWSSPASRRRRPAPRRDAIFDLEKTMAGVAWSRVEMRDPKQIYHPIDRPGLQKLPPRFDWAAYLQQLGHPDLTAFDATTPQSLKQLDGLVVQVPLDTWRAYLRWQLLSRGLAGRCRKAFVDERFAFTSRRSPAPRSCSRAGSAACADHRRRAGRGARRRPSCGAPSAPRARRRPREMVAGIEAAMRRDLGRARLDGRRHAARRPREARTRREQDRLPRSWRNYDALEVERDARTSRSVLRRDAFEMNAAARQDRQAGRPRRSGR